MKIGIVPNLKKNNADGALLSLIDELNKYSAKYYVESTATDALKLTCPALEESEIYRECDLIIAVGGDGTIIHTAKNAAYYNKQILGVNAGRVGYMACLEVSELSLIGKLFSGEYTVENRMMLEAYSRKNPSRKYYCLNDVSINKGPMSRILDMSVRNGNDTFMNLRADGIVVATPTGSTAYAMSAGGPVTDPSIECMVVVPICPMSVYSRGFVLSPEADISISISAQEGAESFVRFDGAEGFLLEDDDAICIKRSASMITRLIKIKQDSFYNILRNKITNI